MICSLSTLKWSSLSLNPYFPHDVKGLVFPKMKISPWFTHPEGILGVYDILLSDEYNRSSIQKYPISSKIYNGSEWVYFFGSSSKSIHP